MILNHLPTTNMNTEGGGRAQFRDGADVVGYHAEIVSFLKLYYSIAESCETLRFSKRQRIDIHPQSQSTDFSIFAIGFGHDSTTEK